MHPRMNRAGAARPDGAGKRGGQFGSARPHPWVGQLCQHLRRSLSGDQRVQDLAAESWIMPSIDAEPRKRFDELMSAVGAPPARVVVETRSPATIKAVVAQTRLLGWLPEPLFAAELAAGLIRPLPCADLACERHFFVHRRRRNFLSPPLVQFLQALQQ